MKDKHLVNQSKKYNFTELSDEELKETFLSEPRGKVKGSSMARRMALVKELIKRTTELSLFDVQLLGALKLLQGTIVEMKTGEGKTIVAVATSLLRYLDGGKTHVITVNDYLAERDGRNAQDVYGFLGLRAEFIISKVSDEAKEKEAQIRKEKYDNADVLYITNSELGFDYLRSNGAYRQEDVLWNIDNALAIIDEADSILIDEAKIPLILSAQQTLTSSDYERANAFVKSIKNRKDRQVFLTAKGTKSAEKFFQMKKPYSDNDYSDIRHLVEQAMVAHFIMERDKDYIKINDEIKLIDQSTGRIAEGRRYNRGLHQAIEAKEKVEIKPENATIATITYQNLFKMYEKISGMTGTAYSERKEFKEI